MKKIKNLRITYYILALPLILIIWSCNILDAEPGFEFQNPEIYFNDLGGGWHTGPSLNIDQNGIVILTSIYPNLEYQLSTREHNAIKKIFKNFDSFKNKYQSGCRDFPVYRIHLKEGRKKKDLEIDYCSLQELNNQEGKQLRNIVGRMLSLSESVYQEKAEWIGLETKYYSGKRKYSEGEPIELFFEIVNPTDKLRTIYFNQEEQINFDVYTSKGRRFGSNITKDFNREVKTEITLDPGETITEKYIWDQVIDLETGSKLEPDKYTLYMYFITSYLDHSGYEVEIIVQ